MRASISQRVQKHRMGLRAAGLRPIQIWVPDTRQEGFSEECRRQSRLAAEAGRKDADLLSFMDKSLADIEGWEA